MTYIIYFDIILKYNKNPSNKEVYDMDNDNQKLEQEVEVVEDKKQEINVVFDLKFKVFPCIWCVLGLILMMCETIIGLNIVSLVSVIFLALTALILAIGIFYKKRVYLFVVFSYILVSLGIFAFYVINGADAGFGAFTSGLKGYSSAASSLQQGEGTFWTRLLGNTLIMLPMLGALVGVILATIFITKNPKAQRIVAGSLSLVLMAIAATFVFYMNLRANPKVDSLDKGHDDYLNSLTANKTKQNSPNVIIILMDDLGYGDVGFYDTAALENSITPNLDALAEEGVIFDNFYSSYSVCSPSRFALMTGRYPYRGYADNVMYPTTNTTSVFAKTRVFNSIEMGANVDGMLGDEITIAETLNAAGYDTACIGKWHLGDYGQYLPTNQGFDYFYGSHSVNDMMPYYFVEEVGGEYVIDYSAFKSKDDNALQQEDTSEILHNKLINWLDDEIDSGNPFFAYYSTPWPHAPVYASEEFSGSTGLGTYADCVYEFDSYVGKLTTYLEEKGVLEDTVIIFSSDNGPALQGSTGGLRGGKYTPYEAGQKVPFFMYFGDNYRGLAAGNANTTISAPITMVDVYPTLVDMLGITAGSTAGALPTDREIDGASIMPVIKGDADFVHGIDNPILHMKREKLHAIQYSIATDELVAQYGQAYVDNQYATGKEYLTYKYFIKASNDNLAFFDKKRKNWLICLTADRTESYNLEPTYPELAADMKTRLNEVMDDLKANRRGIVDNA